LFREIFPHTTTLYIDNWARHLGVVLTEDPEATWEDRRAPLIAKWRGSKAPTLANLREMFYPLLIPTRARLDDFDDDSLSPRFTQDGLLAAISESGGNLNLQTTLQTALWDGSTYSPSAPRVFERIPDMDDGFTFDTVIGTALLDGTAGGIFVEQDAKNVTQLVLGKRGGGGVETRVDQILEGVLTEDLGGFVTSTGPTRWIQIKRVVDELVFYHGPVGGPLVELGRVDIRHKIRRLGFFARSPNTTSVLAFFDLYQLQMETPENNVDIIEVPKAAADVAGEPSYVFQAWLHRSFTNTGTPQLREAQRLADRVKQGHTLIGVIENENFLTDHEFSLTDRDVLGL
jgi:hypothetical protein